MTYVDAVIYANGIILLNAVNAIAANKYVAIAYVNGLKVRTAVCSMIYRKVNTIVF